MTGVLLLASFCSAAVFPVNASTATDLPVSGWVSTQDNTFQLSPVSGLCFQSAGEEAEREEDIEVDDAVKAQSILGLGSSLDHATCYNLSLLPPERREEAIARIVDPERGIGMNLTRICIGTPDFTASPWYTYDDCEPGERDPSLERFSIGKDRETVLPILKTALAINPDLLFVASPWSPPGWMTTNDRIGGGSIRRDCFDVYAEYLARFVEAYEKEGVPIHAITPQNEPDFNPPSYPTCRWTGQEQRDFIRDHLGPLFRDRGIETEIWCWDHNFDKLEFPRAVLSDPDAARYVAGTAFHHYEGKPGAMKTLKEEFPGKEIHFTEGSTFGVTGACRIIDFLRNGAQSYLAWVTVIDHKLQPNRGPHWCAPTCIVLNSEDLALTYRFDYFMYGHFMKFISRGAVRIGTRGKDKPCWHAAFQNPDGSKVLVLAHPGAKEEEANVLWNGLEMRLLLPPKSVMTLRWR